MPSQKRSSTANVLPGSGFSARTPYVQLERYREGKPSLFSKEKCLSLHRSILLQRPKSGKDAALPPLAEAQRYPRRSVMNDREAIPRVPGVCLDGHLAPAPSL